MLSVRPRVLIIDGSSDSREVMQTVLDRRGVDSTTASSKKQGLAAAQESLPTLIVVDAESLPDAENGCQDLVLVAKARQAPIVWLGDVDAHSGANTHHRLPKPYHYSTLLRKIEHLLSAGAPLKLRDASHFSRSSESRIIGEVPVPKARA